jgi:uncharacterized protein YjbI with pentapeptide repeats
MTSAEIKQVLALHKKWLNNEPGGERADLRGADLRGTNLSRANLSEADLSKADLREANLRGADLSKANLSKADLRDANLRKANLRGADLSWADLRGAILSEAELIGAYLYRADLSGACLDFSCFPLWCGGAKFKCDTKLVYQLLAHICTLEFDDTEGIKTLIMPFAMKSHRAVDLELEEESE